MFIITTAIVFIVYCLIYNEYVLRARYRQLSVYNVKQLKAMAKDNGVKRYSAMRRAELLDVLYTVLYTK